MEKNGVYLLLLTSLVDVRLVCIFIIRFHQAQCESFSFLSDKHRYCNNSIFFILSWEVGGQTWHSAESLHFVLEVVVLINLLAK